MKNLPSRRLSDLRIGEAATIKEVMLPEEDRRRMNVLGFAIGNEVFASRTVPGGDPTLYEIDGNNVALRREAAMHVVVSAARAGTPE